MTNIFYETGVEVPEILGSGSSYYSVLTTPSEALARAEYKKCGRNYLLRYDKQPDGMRTSWWDDDLNCWRE